jgi:hypothetical protein
MTNHGSLPHMDLDYIQCKADWPRQYAAGRRCAHEGCGTILSRYNGEATCELHTPPPDCSRYHGYPVLVCPTCHTVRLMKQKKTTDPVCQTCRNAERLKEAMGERQQAVGLRPGEAICTKCGEPKPATNEFFVVRPDGRRESACRVCESKRQSDYYYRKTYGQTRQEYLEDSA